MDPRVLEVKDAAVLGTDDKGGTSAWHDEVRSMIFKRPENAGTNCGDKCNDLLPAKPESAETPEVKAAYAKMLEKTKGVDPVAISDSINLFGDLAASNGKVPKFAAGDETKLTPNAASPEGIVEPQVAQAYNKLLQRGLNPVLIIDVLNVAGDVAAIAMSPQGQKLFGDIKTLITHLRG